MQLKLFKRKIPAALLLSLILIVLVLLFKKSLFRLLMVPPYPFVELDASTKPDYSDQKNWIAHPEKQDAADITAIDETDNQQSTAAVDVFFIHPTTYFGTRLWNDPLDGSGHIFPKGETLKINASVFNGCCRIYAPAFRQGTMFSYATDDNRLHSITFGSEDVLRAFDYYMEHSNHGRPIIIASHSQGADHGLILLSKRFTGRPLLKQLVAAYLVGRPIGKEQLASYLPDIPVCRSEQESGCLLSWMTVGARHNFNWLRDRASFVSEQGLGLYKSQATVCTNPLSWKDDETREGAEKHLGFYKMEHDKPTLQELKVSARCDKGALIIEPDFFEALTFGNSYHIYDYGLFYKNIRENALKRSSQHLQH